MLCGEEGGVAGEQSLGGLLGAAPLSARCVTGNLRWQTLVYKERPAVSVAAAALLYNITVVAILFNRITNNYIQI